MCARLPLETGNNEWGSSSAHSIIHLKVVDGLDEMGNKTWTPRLVATNTGQLVGSESAKYQVVLQGILYNSTSEPFLAGRTEGPGGGILTGWPLETAALRLLSGPQGSMWLESPRYVLDLVSAM